MNVRADGSLEAHTAHSIYFEVMAQQGFLGLIIYVSCLFSVLLSLRRCDHISRSYSNGEWISNFSRGFFVSIVGFMVCGAFISKAFFELIWTIFAASVSFIHIVESGDWLEENP
jgi:hypothetical protein